MGRSRKRRPATPASGDAVRDVPRAAPADGDAMARGYARTRVRNDAVRARLEPLAPGERPRILVVAAVVAALVAVANVVLLLAGWEQNGEEVQPTGLLIFSGVMLVAAVGIWQRRYWAVLGFQALLGISILTSSLSLLVASNLQAAFFCVLIIAVSGALFWPLVRAMARMKMPERPASG